MSTTREEEALALVLEGRDEQAATTLRTLKRTELSTLAGALRRLLDLVQQCEVRLAQEADHADSGAVTRGDD